MYGGVPVPGQTVPNGVRRCPCRWSTDGVRREYGCRCLLRVVYGGVRQVCCTFGVRTVYSRCAVPLVYGRCTEVCTAGVLFGVRSVYGSVRSVYAAVQCRCPLRLMLDLFFLVSSAGLRLASRGRIGLAQAHQPIRCHTMAPPPQPQVLPAIPWPATGPVMSMS